MEHVSVNACTYPYIKNRHLGISIFIYVEMHIVFLFKGIALCGFLFSMERLRIKNRILQLDSYLLLLVVVS